MCTHSQCYELKYHIFFLLNFSIFTAEKKSLYIGLTIKNCWFAVFLPTHQNWPYPPKKYGHSGDFFLNLKTMIQFQTGLLIKAF